MRVLKVVAEGLTTSFRYPHFKQQIHPTFPLPPPATIYGHICSALGELFDPDGVQFAYHFTCQGQVSDMEHIVVLSPATGRRGPTNFSCVMEGAVSPFRRELLFMPRLTLYLNRPDWAAAFHSPRYAVVLGRSQDLFTYTQVEVMDLLPAEKAYLEHTIAPPDMALRTGRGVTMIMPRYLDYAQGRRPTFGRYLVLEDRVYSSEFYHFGDSEAGPFWTDPTSKPDRDMHLGLMFHTFTGQDVGRTALA